MTTKTRELYERPQGLRFEPMITRRITTVTAVRQYPPGREPFVTAWVGYCYSCHARRAFLVAAGHAHEQATLAILGHKCSGDRGSQS